MMDIVEILDDVQVVSSEFNEEEGLEVTIDNPVASTVVELNDYLELPDSWISVRTASVNPQFTMQGTLTVRAGDSKYPIAAGNWKITSILGTLKTAAGTQSVIVDVNVNGVTIFPGAKLTFAPGAVVSAVGAWNDLTLTLGDVLTVDVDQVGSGGVFGDTLVLSILLERIN
jgi:hypothetical protein